jgi:hypothetical protein
MAYESEIENLIMIDADEGWNPKDFFKLLSYDVHIVGGTARKKTDKEESYCIRIKDGDKKLTIESSGLIEVSSVGMGFCRFSRYAIKKLWESSKIYIENGKEKRMVFNVTIQDKILTSEDVSLCFFWKSLNEKIWFDPSIIVIHIGIKSFIGNFKNWAIKNNLINL